MKRVYHRYEKWEDFKAGMFLDVTGDSRMVMIRCSDLLRNPDALYQSMSYVAEFWINAAEHNLTNRSLNRHAWLGQAACCFEFSAPDAVTKLAWHTLTADEQEAANAVANAVINEWEHERIGGSCA